MPNTKPLIRWVVGPAKKEGYICLQKTINCVKNIYKECDFLICHNQLNEWQIETIKKMEVKLYDQSQSARSFTIEPQHGYQVHWKLYPPRLALDTHEIVIDNDIMLFKRLSEIDAFLQSDCTLMCHGLNGLHGKFDKYVPKGVRVNSGLYGMPPNFNFINIMKSNIEANDLIKWSNRFDEQGLVAAILNKYHKRIFIPVTTLPIVEPNFDLQGITTEACCGYHFVGLNYKENHNAWKNYINYSIKI